MAQSPAWPGHATSTRSPACPFRSLCTFASCSLHPRCFSLLLFPLGNFYLCVGNFSLGITPRSLLCTQARVPYPPPEPPATPSLHAPRCVSLEGRSWVSDQPCVRLALSPQFLKGKKERKK